MEDSTCTFEGGCSIFKDTFPDYENYADYFKQKKDDDDEGCPLDPITGRRKKKKSIFDIDDAWLKMYKKNDGDKRRKHGEDSDSDDDDDDDDDTDNDWLSQPAGECCQHRCDKINRKKFISNFSTMAINPASECMQVEKSRCRAFWKLVDSRPELLSLMKNGEFDYLSTPQLAAPEEGRHGGRGAGGGGSGSGGSGGGRGGRGAEELLTARERSSWKSGSYIDDETCSDSDALRLRARHKAMHDEERGRTAKRREQIEELQRKAGQAIRASRPIEIFDNKPKEFSIAKNFSDFSKLIYEMNDFDKRCGNPVRTSWNPPSKTTSFDWGSLYHDETDTSAFKPPYYTTDETRGFSSSGPEGSVTGEVTTARTDTAKSSVVPKTSVGPRTSAGSVPAAKKKAKSIVSAK